MTRPIERRCLKCHQPFRTIRSYQKFCCVICRNDYNRKKNRLSRILKGER